MMWQHALCLPVHCLPARQRCPRLPCRLQQVRSRWSEIPHIRQAVERLSADCMDLLNKIFVIDEKKRITIEGIKAHPWWVACMVLGSLPLGSLKHNMVYNAHPWCAGRCP